MKMSPIGIIKTLWKRYLSNPPNERVLLFRNDVYLSEDLEPGRTQPLAVKGKTAEKPRF